MRKRILPARFFENDVDYYAQFDDDDYREVLGDNYPDEQDLDF